jgi:ATP-binding cassette, subfamily B, bacterial
VGQPDSGRVEIDGAELATHSAGNAIGLAAPDMPLLRGSVKRNVRYRVPDADPAEIARTLQAMQLESGRAAVESHGWRPAWRRTSA